MSANINFYDPKLRLVRDWLALDVLVLATVVLVLLLSGAVYALNVAVTGMQAQSDSLKVRIDERKQAQDTWTRQRAQVDAEFKQRRELASLQIRQRQALLDLIDEKSGAANPARHADAMRAFSRQHYPGLWLTGFTFENGMRQIELRGRALDGDRFPGYVQRLRREPAFAGSQFDNLLVARPADTEQGTAAAKAKPAAYLEFTLTNRVVDAETAKAGVKP